MRTQEMTRGISIWEKKIAAHMEGVRNGETVQIYVHFLYGPMSVHMSEYGWRTRKEMLVAYGLTDGMAYSFRPTSQAGGFVILQGKASEIMTVVERMRKIRGGQVSVCKFLDSPKHLLKTYPLETAN